MDRKNEKTNQDGQIDDDSSETNRLREEEELVKEFQARAITLKRSPQAVQQETMEEEKAKAVERNNECMFTCTEDGAWRATSDENLCTQREEDTEDTEMETESEEAQNQPGHRDRKKLEIMVDLTASGDEDYYSPRESRIYPLFLKQEKKEKESWETPKPRRSQRKPKTEEEKAELTKRGRDTPPEEPRRKKNKEMTRIKEVQDNIDELIDIAENRVTNTSVSIKKLARKTRLLLQDLVRETKAEEKRRQEESEEVLKDTLEKYISEYRKTNEAQKKAMEEKDKEIREIKAEVRKLREEMEKTGRKAAGIEQQQQREDMEKKRREEIVNLINDPEKKFEVFWEAAKEEWPPRVMAAITKRKGNPIREKSNIMVIHREMDKDDRGILKYIKDTYDGGKAFVDREGNGKKIMTLKIITEREVDEGTVKNEKCIHGLKLTKQNLEQQHWEEVFETFKVFAEKAIGEGKKELAVRITNKEMEYKAIQLLLYITGNSELHVEVHNDRKTERTKDQGEGEEEQGGRERKVRNRNMKTTAIMVPKDGTNRTYAQMLKEVRNMKEEIQEKGIEIESVRETRSGDLLIVMEKGNQKIEEMKESVKKKFNGAKVATIGEVKKVVLFATGLDTETTVEEVREEVMRATKEAPDNELKVTDLRPTFGNMRKVNITTTEETAIVLERARRVRIGLNMCYIRRRVHVDICGNCMEAGHNQAKCKGTNRRNNCYKCGKEGHIAKDCTDQPRCFVCMKEGHRTNTAACPVFRMLLKDRREN